MTIDLFDASEPAVPPTGTVRFAGFELVSVIVPVSALVDVASNWAESWPEPTV